MPAADPNKTVTFEIDRNGNIRVVATHTEGYPALEITITKQGDSKFRRTAADVVGVPKKEQVGPAGAKFEKQTVELKAVDQPAGTYTVTVVCTGTTFVGTVTVPAQGVGPTSLERK